jgi:hypothetical protein
MTEIDMAHYQKGDALKLNVHIPQPEVLDDLFMKGDSYTAFVDEVPIFCGGISMYWPGHAEVWLIMGTTAKKYIGTVLKMRDLLELVIQKHRLFRISAHCDSSLVEADRLVRHLGFRQEARLDCYGPNKETFNLYGRVLWQR